MDEIWVLCYCDEIRAFDDAELAFRDAAEIAYRVSSFDPVHYDFELIDAAIRLQSFEKAVSIFNSTDWLDDSITVRKVPVQQRMLCTPTTKRPENSLNS